LGGSRWGLRGETHLATLSSTSSNNQCLPAGGVATATFPERRLCLSSGRGSVWKNRRRGMKFHRTRLLNFIVIFRRCSHDVGIPLSPATRLIATTVCCRNSFRFRSRFGNVVAGAESSISSVVADRFYLFPRPLDHGDGGAQRVVARALAFPAARRGRPRVPVRARYYPVEKPVRAYSVVLFSIPYNIVPVLYAAARHGSCTTATTTLRLCNIIIVIVRSSQNDNIIVVAVLSLLL